VGLIALLLLVAVVLLLVNRYGLQSYFVGSFGHALTRRGYDANQIVFLAQVYFSAFSFAVFVLVPLLFHRVFPVSMDDAFGLSFRRCIKHIPVYLVLSLMMLPILWVAAMRPGFYEFYPMYKPATLGYWLAFEMVYMAQFFCVEFFFRGFTLFRLEQRFGYHAVTIMVIPYALLHLYKPFPEALSSIVAGLVLGMLALKSRSIWPGVMLHCTVAFCMDLFALIHSGRITALL